MVQVGVRELRNHLSEYLARVAAGEDVVVTDRGHPVARLGPLHGEAALDRLVANGLVTRAVSPKRPATVRRVRGQVSDLVADQRR